MTSVKIKTVLVSPLNWGLGHATRMIPVINALKQNGHKVIIASYGKSGRLLEKEFPDCINIRLKGFTPGYSLTHTQTFSLFLQILPFIYYKHYEYRQTRKLVEKYNIDIIISDNRYGVRNRNTKSIIVTHQVSPVLNGFLKIFEKPASYFISRWINKFDKCWVPDIASRPGLTGKLSDNTFNLKNIVRTGILSRFRQCKYNQQNYHFKYIAIISGPEPWRQELEKNITSVFIKTKEPCIIVRGVPGQKNKSRKTGNITIYDHCESSMLNNLICDSENIICRSGYSSVMDLVTLRRNALLIPTPGQPEQEYLARHLNTYYGFKTIEQKKLKNTHLKTITENVIFPNHGNKLPENMIDSLL
ncbi:MAG: glycosyltransferase [Chlorobi bacterium]|nr:glycosyltransferase [Chlorobiota bacterium]